MNDTHNEAPARYYALVDADNPFGPALFVGEDEAEVSGYDGGIDENMTFRTVEITAESYAAVLAGDQYAWEEVPRGGATEPVVGDPTSLSAPGYLEFPANIDPLFAPGPVCPRGRAMLEGFIPDDQLDRISYSAWASGGSLTGGVAFIVTATDRFRFYLAWHDDNDSLIGVTQYPNMRGVNEVDNRHYLFPVGRELTLYMRNAPGLAPSWYQSSERDERGFIEFVSAEDDARRAAEEQRYRIGIDFIEKSGENISRTKALEAFGLPANTRPLNYTFRDEEGTEDDKIEGNHLVP